MKRKHAMAGSLGRVVNRALRGAMGVDTTDQILQYTIQPGDSLLTISSNTGDSQGDILDLNNWMGNMAATDSLAPVNNGGQYDGVDYTGTVINYYNPNYVAPSSAPTATAAAPASTAAPTVSQASGLLSSLSNLTSGLAPVITGTVAKAAGVTTTGANAAASTQTMMLYIGLGAIALIGGYFLIFEEEKKGMPKAGNPRRRKHHHRKHHHKRHRKHHRKATKSVSATLAETPALPLAGNPRRRRRKHKR